ncbi:MAG: magnesium chelatase [Isosphaeraceae bacterium]|nr:magnesium chelatase [Isosphaeraceae bacterium]
MASVRGLPWLLRGFALAASLLGGTAWGQDVTIKPDPPGSSPSGADRLRPDGSDRYAPKVDWSQIPPWRQTSFFGLRARGQFFVYVVDCSGSMADAGRLARAKQEIRRSVMGLRWPQKFLVIFYNDRPLPMPGGGVPQPADLSAKNQLVSWFRLIQPDGETDPRGAMALALGLRPDAIFLLSDGEFPSGAAAAIAQKNPYKVPIHCIDLAGAGGDQLKQIARDSGGQYVVRP